MRSVLLEFGSYIGECLPKYVQRARVTHGDELEVLIHPDGIIPVMTFLKDHTNCQFLNVADICAVDVPTKPHRFEVLTHTLQDSAIKFFKILRQFFLNFATVFVKFWGNISQSKHQKSKQILT